jgi:hypothetical protein
MPEMILNKNALLSLDDSSLRFHLFSIGGLVPWKLVDPSQLYPMEWLAPP